MIAGYRSLLKTVQSTVGCDPEVAIMILKKSIDVRIGKPVPSGEWNKTPVPELIKPVVGADPYVSVSVLQQRVDEVVRKPLLPGVPAKLPVLFANHYSGIGAKPERTVAVLQRSADVIVPDCFNVALIEDGKVFAIKSHQTFLGPQPDVTVFSLRNNLHRILREAFLCPPHAVNIFTNGSRRGLGKTQGSKAQKSDHKSEAISCEGFHASSPDLREFK
jgi:hypothetical protein